MGILLGLVCSSMDMHTCLITAAYPPQYRRRHYCDRDHPDCIDIIVIVTSISSMSIALIKNIIAIGIVNITVVTDIIVTVAIVLVIVIIVIIDLQGASIVNVITNIASPPVFRLDLLYQAITIHLPAFHYGGGVR